ncbi:MAG: hypothetical protein IJZ35_05855 [Clostridia bacterium]|nr:hypothetical protein [Clostridia bacterium]
MYTYYVSYIAKNDKWIFVQCNEEDSILDYEPFDALVKSIAKKWNNNQYDGNITSIGNTQYKIKNDPMDLIYQWDDLFGIVLIFS